VFVLVCVWCVCNQKPEKKSSILIKNLNHNYFLNRQRRENCNQSLSFSLPLSLWEAEEEAAAAKQTPHTNTNAFSLWKRNQPKCCGKFLLLFCKNLFLIQEMHLIFFRSYMLSIIMICAAVSSSKAPFLFANFLLLPSSLTAASSSYTNTPFFAHLSLFPRRACECVCARAVFR